MLQNSCIFLRLVVFSHYLHGFIHPWCRISSNSMCCEQQALLILPKKMASIGSSTSHHALVGNDNDSTPLKVNGWDQTQVKREIMFKPAFFGFNILIFQGEHNYDHLKIWNCKGWPPKIKSSRVTYISTDYWSLMESYLFLVWILLFELFMLTFDSVWWPPRPSS